MLDRAVARVASLVTRTEPPQVFTEIGRHPRLFRTWLPFAGTLLLCGALPRSETELVILRTAWNARSEYEWEQHAELATRVGLSDAQVAAIRTGAGADVWTSRQRLLLEAVDQLHEARCVDAATRAALDDELSSKQVVELCFLVGHYEMLAMLLNTRRIEPDQPAAVRRSDFGHCSNGAERHTLRS